MSTDNNTHLKLAKIHLAEAESDLRALADGLAAAEAENAQRVAEVRIVAGGIAQLHAAFLKVVGHERLPERK